MHQHRHRTTLGELDRDDYKIAQDLGSEGTMKMYSVGIEGVEHERTNLPHPITIQNVMRNCRDGLMKDYSEVKGFIARYSDGGGV
jgi:hypothetical protein